MMNTVLCSTLAVEYFGLILSNAIHFFFINAKCAKKYEHSVRKMRTLCLPGFSWWSR